MALIERPAFVLIGAWAMAHGGWKAVVIVAWVVFVASLVEAAEYAIRDHPRRPGKAQRR